MGGGGWRGDTFLLLSQRSLAPWMYPVNTRGLGPVGKGRGLQGNRLWLPLPLPFLAFRKALQKNGDKLSWTLGGQPHLDLN